MSPERAFLSEIVSRLVILEETMGRGGGFGGAKSENHIDPQKPDLAKFAWG
jgi:hypothetical protein